MSNISGDGPTAPPGWYKDAQGTLRWWDGSGWTERVQADDISSANPYGQPPATQATAPWYKKKRWWAAGAFIVLIAASMSGGGESPGETETASAETATSAEVTPEEEPVEETSTEEATKKPERTKKSEPEPAKPQAVTVQAGKMLKEFEGNEAAADAKYGGKIVQVTGHVAKVDTEFLDDEQYVIMLDGGDEWAFLSVNCRDVTADVAAKVQADSTITVRGTFDDGGDLGIEIKDCTVV